MTLVTVLAAVLVGVGKLLMPYSDHYQPQLEAWLSKAFNQPVKVESFDGEWKAFGPRISLRGVTLMPEGMQSEIAINHAALDIKPLNALIPGRPLYSFRIIGADLSLERTEDGRYLLSGLGVSNRGSGRGSSSGLRDVALNGEVRLENVSLSFDDPVGEIHLVLTSVNGRLKMDGRRLAAEIQARVTDGARRRVVGDLEATVQIRLDSEQHLAEARWHVKTGELMLAELVRQLPHHPLIPVSGWLNAEAWGGWQQGEPQQMQGVIDLREAQLSSQSGPLVIDHLNSRFNFHFVQRKDWRMDLSDLTVTSGDTEWQSQRLSVARNLPEDLGLWVSSDYLELDFPVQLTQRIMASYNTQWPAAIPRRAQGTLTDFDLVLDAGWRLKQTAGQLENGHFWGWDKGPDISGLNARVQIAAGAGDAGIDGSSVTLDWPRIFRRPLTVELSDCRVEVHWDENREWQFDLNRCKAHNEDISAFGRVRMASSENKPEVDINVAMEYGDISRFGDYWPENVIKQRTLHWLRTSLLSGRVVQGRYSMTGDLDDFPFANHRGRLQAIAEVEGADLKFADQWPRARQVKALAHFEGAGMRVEGEIGNTAGASVKKVTATIGNFKKPVLDVAYETSTGIQQLVGYIRQTPLLDNLALDPDQFILTGGADIYGRLHTRLGQASEPLQVTGAVQMKDVVFTDRVSGVELDTISGKLEYDREGLNASQLAAAYRDYPVTLDIVADWDADEVFRATLHGNLPVATVIPDDMQQREPLFRQASGNSDWDISLSVASLAGSDERETWLALYSGLEGTAVDLPAPLNKPANASWPITVHYPVRTENRLLSVDIPGHVRLKMELSEEGARPVRAAVQLGGTVGELPADGLFILNGSAPVFDLDGWLGLVIDRFKQDEEIGGLSLQSAGVDADQIMIFNRLFDDVALTLNYQDEVITSEFDSTDIAGKVRYYKNQEGSHSLTGEFERLMMPDPVAEGMTMETEPADLPEMHFFSKEFSYLGLNLGETRIEGYPVQNGFHLESVESQAPSLVFSARGDWLKDDQGERSDFDIHISSESLGGVLEAMDISSAMQGGQTLVHFDAWWQGPPAAFALERLNGEMDLSVVQGNILTANAGAGRMLGLLSLTELPRRLAMDFRDVFDEGFSFDEARGTMRLENGTSYTDDLILSSTAAEISIVGSTDLVAQTFDYEFAVRPGVSKTLPVIGAIAGGPAGAAAGLALQALLRESLGDAAEARYMIRGPWSDPLVEPVEKPPQHETVDDNPPTDPLTDVQPGQPTGTTGQQQTGEDGND